MSLVYQVIHILISGLQIGSIYALVALGYSMVYGIIKLVNFAHGDIIMVGAYCAWYLMSRHAVPPALACALSVAFCSVLGVLIEKIAYKPLRRSGRLSLLVTAIGVSLFLQNAVQLMFKADPRMFANFFTGAVTIGGRQFSSDTAATIIISLIIMAALTALVKYTRVGKAMRAVSEDSETAQLMGVDVNSTISFTFAIGSGLAAIGSIFYCCSYSQIQPTMGSMLGLKAFVAAVLGGIGSIPGAMIGGFCIGIGESVTKGFINSKLTDAVVFGVLIFVLLMKPSGIFGRAGGEKV
jgi:branched-chain amino acid transport system permease protein